jgi:curli biogenesis system outer membrane secretion channel CsgG
MAGLPRVAVLKVENKTAYRGIVKDLEDGTADMFVTSFASTKKLKVIERSELEKVLQEQKLGVSGAVTPQTAAQIGKVLGVEYIVLGSVNEYGTQESDLGAFGVGVKTHTASVGLDIRVIDTTSAEIVSAATGQCKKSTKAVGINNNDIFPTNIKVGSPHFSTSLIGKAARGAVDDAVAKVIKDIGGAWHGAVIKVGEDGTVSINGGDNVGIQVNDIFTVVRKGEEMIDPETNESLGSEDSVIGEIRVVEVKPKYANAKIVKGKDVQKNDRVEKK